VNTLHVLYYALIFYDVSVTPCGTPANIVVTHVMGISLSVIPVYYKYAIPQNVHVDLINGKILQTGYTNLSCWSIVAKNMELPVNSFPRWVFNDASPTAVKFPDISRFSRHMVTLHCKNICIGLRHFCTDSFTFANCSWLPAVLIRLFHPGFDVIWHIYSVPHFCCCTWLVWV